MNLIAPLVVVIIVIALFLVLREFWCWYFKINRVIKLLEKIEENTRTTKPKEAPVKLPMRY